MSWVPPSTTGRARSGRSAHVSGVAPGRQGGLAEVTRGTVKSIKGLAGHHPVWLLTMEGVWPMQVQMVLKVETGMIGFSAADAAAAAQFVGAVMGEVSPGVTLTMLTDAEIFALIGMPRSKWESQQAYEVFAERFLKPRRSKQPVFIYKMPFMTGLQSLEGNHEGEDMTGLDVHGHAHQQVEDRRKARLLLFVLLPALRDPQNPALYRLGKITVVDMFTGNLDRICCNSDPFNPTALDAGLTNHGNVLFRLDEQHGFSPIGLDFYDPYNTTTTIYRDLPHGEPWVEGELLKDPQKMVSFGTSVIQMLNRGFARTLSSNVYDGSNRQQVIAPAAHELLGHECARGFAQGMIDGVQELRRILETRGWASGLPSGIRSRMQYMGWL